MKPCLIRQPAGIGDILFTQKIGKRLLETGRCNKVIWPVSKYYNYLQSYIGVDGIEYVNENSDFEFSKFELKQEINELIDAGLSLSAAAKYLAKKKNLNKRMIYNLF